MEQLRDSRLLFEKKLPAFGFILLLIITCSLVGVIIWSIYAKKPYMIIAQGTVTSSDSSYVMPVYTGEIEQCYLEEGKLVEEGEVLFTIKSTDYNVQEEQLEESRQSYEKQKEQSERLVQSIKDDINYFDASEAEDELYYSTFEAYKAQVTQNTFDASMYQAYGYSEEQIENELEKNQGKVSEIYYSAIRSAENMVQEAQTQIDAIDAQLLAIGSGQAEYSVKAASTGILHLLADYKSGMVVQTGSAVGTITPENADVLIEAYVSTADMARMEEGDKVELAVDGLVQSVYGNISGTVKTIDSNVTSIEGKDGSSNSVFKIKVEPSEDYVVSKTGKKVNLSNGMTVETRIIYDEVTYFNYVIEKLGLMTK
ncbi:MAG: HlyD family efflux transporter periplasmic adaptor subunit [Roseburia sp.]|nr:HlyD family efflux transporter periplasmic adaptor subunit [Roseburia sp.]